MGNRRICLGKYRSKEGKIHSGKLSSKREKRMDKDIARANRQWRRNRRRKKDWLDLLEIEDLDKATHFTP